MAGASRRLAAGPLSQIGCSAGTLYTDADNAWGNGTNANRQTAAVDAAYGRPARGTTSRTPTDDATNYSGARAATVKAAGDLFGAGSTQAAAVATTWDAVSVK